MFRPLLLGFALLPLQSARQLSAWNPLPLTGEQPLLVILCDFPDEAGLFTGRAWDERFFGAGGFAEYFVKNSYGRLRYTGQVVGLSRGTGQPVVNSSSIDYVRLPETLPFYAGGQHGFKVTRCSRRNHAGVALDALMLLDEAGFDFSPYAQSSTGVVQNVIIVSAAPSFYREENANASFLSTAYELSYVFQGCPPDLSRTVTTDGHFKSRNNFRVNAYTFCTARTKSDDVLAVLGVCIHEHGHALGLQDWYGVGQYSLMGQGAWGPDTTGKYPAHMCAFDKISNGWLEPRYVERTPLEAEYTLLPSHIHPDALILLLSQNHTSEYFIIENRQELAFGSPWLKGHASKFCPGILIWHIDSKIASRSTRYWQLNTVNARALPGDPGVDAPPHMGIAVDEADGDNSLIVDSHTDYECGDMHRNTTGAHSPVLWNQSPSGVTVRVLGTADAQGNVRVAVQCSSCVHPAFAIAPSTTERILIVSAAMSGQVAIAMTACTLNVLSFYL